MSRSINLNLKTSKYTENNFCTHILHSSVTVDGMNKKSRNFIAFHLCAFLPLVLL